VLVHGITAPLGARRYGQWFARAIDVNPRIREGAEAPSLKSRVRLTHGPPIDTEG
jgi:hypothetical protein